MPWTADIEPDRGQLIEMSTVCAECPVVNECAAYALTGGDGGFYAGIWVPWSRTVSDSLLCSRRNARNALRRVAVSV